MIPHTIGALGIVLVLLYHDVTVLLKHNFYFTYKHNC